MNKEVEVNGLNLKATASEGLEISCGAVGTAKVGGVYKLNGVDANNSIVAPAVLDASWKRQIVIDDYYKEVGCLAPASTNNPLILYSVPTTKVSGGGHYVDDDATVSQATKMATFTPEYNTADPLINLDDDTIDWNNGYYIDIPMWIRAANNSSTGGTPIYCGVTITDGETSSENLMKAVRVAIIPMANSADNSAVTVTDNATLVPTSGVGNPTIYALKAPGKQIGGATDEDYPTYRGKTLGDNSTKTTYSSNLVDQPTYVEANDAQATGGTANTEIKNGTAVFTIPKGDANCYGQVGFIARVWIEGESIYCEDATAKQDWNIDFYFTTDAPTGGGAG